MPYPGTGAPTVTALQSLRYSAPPTSDIFSGSCGEVSNAAPPADSISAAHLVVGAASASPHQVVFPTTSDNNACTSRCDDAATAPPTLALQTASHCSVLPSENVAPTTIVSPRSLASDEATPTYLSDDAPM